MRRDDGRGYSSAVPRTRIPDEILSLAHDRAAARGARDWAAADRIRAEIEAAGWKIVDRGTDFALEPAHPPTVADGEIVRYGSTEAVPSRAAEPDAGRATVVVVATEWPADLERALAGLRAYNPIGVSMVVVADGPSPEQDAALPGDALPGPTRRPRATTRRSCGHPNGWGPLPPGTSASGGPMGRS